MVEALVLRSLSAAMCRAAGSQRDLAVRDRLLAASQECETRAAELDHEKRRGDIRYH